MASKRKILFRADAGAEIGYGHFIRTLALADMLKDDFECVLYTQTPSEYQRKESEKVCKLVELPSDDTRFPLFLNVLKGDEIVVLDNYFYTTDYQQAIKEKGCRLVCIDDMHDKHYVADLVVNHALTNTNLFDCEPYTKLCLGLNYALLRAPFLRCPIETVRNNDLVVSFGGSDPYGITNRIVSLLLQSSIPYRIVVILGDKVCLSESLLKRVTVKKNLSAEQIAKLFEQSAAGILSASTVCIEALSRNMPLMVGYYVENQIEFYQLLESQNFIQPLGFLQEIDHDTLLKAIGRFRNTIALPFDSTIIKANFLSAFKNLKY